MPVLDAPPGTEIQLWQQPQLWQPQQALKSGSDSEQLSPGPVIHPTPPALGTGNSRSPLSLAARGYSSFPGNPVPGGTVNCRERSREEEHLGDVADALKASEKPQELEMLVSICDSPGPSLLECWLAAGMCWDALGTHWHCPPCHPEEQGEPPGGAAPSPSISQLGSEPSHCQSPAMTCSAQGISLPTHAALGEALLEFVSPAAPPVGEATSPVPLLLCHPWAFPMLMNSAPWDACPEQFLRK